MAIGGGKARRGLHKRENKTTKRGESDAMYSHREKRCCFGNMATSGPEFHRGEGTMEEGERPFRFRSWKGVEYGQKLVMGTDAGDFSGRSVTTK